jgi:sugar phosphate isomerase/epimerase
VLEQPAPFAQSETERTSSLQAEKAKGLAIARLSINDLTTFAWDLDDELVAYHREGVRAVGLWRPKLGHFGEERAAELLRELGISVSSLCWAGGFTGSNRWSFEDSLADARAAIRAAALVGADCLCVVSGPQNGHIQSHLRRLIIDALKVLAPEAAEAGVTLALQPMHVDFAPSWTFLHALDETLAIAQAAGGGVKLACDVYHLRNEQSLESRIAEFTPHLALVQLCDARGKRRSERRLLGDGEIPIAALMQAFEESGYTGYYELSTWSRPLWRRDYCELLRECRARFEALCHQPVPAAVAGD